MRCLTLRSIFSLKLSCCFLKNTLRPTMYTFLPWLYKRPHTPKVYIVDLRVLSKTLRCKVSFERPALFIFCPWKLETRCACDPERGPRKQWQERHWRRKRVEWDRIAQYRTTTEAMPNGADGFLWRCQRHDDVLRDTISIEANAALLQRLHRVSPARNIDFCFLCLLLSGPLGDRPKKKRGGRLFWSFHTAFLASKVYIESQTLFAWRPQAKNLLLCLKNHGLAKNGHCQEKHVFERVRNIFWASVRALLGFKYRKNAELCVARLHRPQECHGKKDLSFQKIVTPSFDGCILKSCRIPRSF